MTSPVDICNKALGWVGTRSTISSLTQNSPEARACNQFYDGARQDALQMFWWGFAGAQVQLTLLGTAQDQTALIPWQYKYAYPSDALQCRFLLLTPTFSPDGNPLVSEPWLWLRDSQQAAIPYEISSDFDGNGNLIKVISTNQVTALMTYTRDVQVVDMFDNQFNTALEHLLASYLAIPLMGNVEVAERERKIAADAVQEAASSSGNEGVTVHQQLPDWIQARGNLGFDQDFCYPYSTGGWRL